MLLANVRPSVGWKLLIEKVLKGLWNYNWETSLLIYMVRPTQWFYQAIPRAFPKTLEWYKIQVCTQKYDKPGYELYVWLQIVLILFFWLFDNFLLKMLYTILKVTLHLQLLQNISHISCVVPYSLVAYLTPISLYLPNAYPYIAL